ncbi:YciI family protein [Microbacterium xanthum]|uniref:YciI family protein n=1 Tax=Microbacterium xanthum TaxID=3079794 RepID=UPI002AD2788A|nr:MULTISPECIES: YciI family protein [unclassified Microbacterium]MDZ8171566.1 YciI family protein [Microbacterium sp. KSW-48]MDZ8200395.1 YciI family protein [Microbacterium sp. SSW1-59]
MQYLLLLADEPGAGPAQDSPEFAAEMGEWFAFDQMVKDAGVFVAGEALHPQSTATTVRVREGRTVLTDGPYAETKEHLGGFYVLEVADLDEAISYAEKIPNVGYGAVEIRPVLDVSDMQQ